MSLIHIARNNVVLGQFTDSDVAAGLNSGTYLPTDLAWRPGMSGWKPLGEWPEFSTPGAPGFTVPPVPADFPEFAAQTEPAWERRAEIGFFSALIVTSKQVLQKPDSTFAAMKRTGGLGGPLTYYLIPQIAFGLLISVSMAVLMAIILSMPNQQAGTPRVEELKKLLGGFGAIGIGIVYFLFFTIMAPVLVFLMAGLDHLMLKLWGAAGASFEVTFRVTAYVSGALALTMMPLQLLGFIPCVGVIFSLIAMALAIWGIIVRIKGYSITHGSSTGRCAGAVLTPIVVCCCGGGLFYFAIFAAMIGAKH